MTPCAETSSARTIAQIAYLNILCRRRLKCYEYFKHTSYTSVFRGLDGWVRRRLRRILLKRHKISRHSGLGTAHQRWPNAFFAEQGLFSMEAAHVRIRQSALR